MKTEEIMKLADAYAAAYMSFSESKARAALEAALSAKQERISELEAQNAQLLEKAKELCDRIYDEGCTPLDWREYDDLRAAIAAVESLK